MKKLLTFCRANSTTGMGHLSRLLELCRVARDKGWSPTLCVHPDDLPFVQGLVGGIDVWSPASGANDFASALGNQAKETHSILLLDLPEAEYRALEAIHGSGVTVVTLTMFDYGNEGRFENLSIFPDYSGDSVREAASPNGAMRILSGSSYLMISPRFFSQQYTDPKEMLSAFVTMGGADPANITELVIRSLKIAKLENVTVAIGSANTNREQLLGMMPSTWTALDQGSFDFSGELSKHRLAIINGGVTRYECAAIGTPFAAISLHNYQASITQRLVHDGFGFELGVYDRLTPEKVGARVIDILALDSDTWEAMRSKGSSMIQREGAANIIVAIEDLVTSGS